MIANKAQIAKLPIIISCPITISKILKTKIKLNLKCPATPTPNKLHMYIGLSLCREWYDCSYLTNKEA